MLNVRRLARPAHRRGRRCRRCRCCLGRQEGGRTIPRRGEQQQPSYLMHGKQSFLPVAMLNTKRRSWAAPGARTSCETTVVLQSCDIEGESKWRPAKLCVDVQVERGTTVRTSQLAQIDMKAHSGTVRWNETLVVRVRMEKDPATGKFARQDLFFNIIEVLCAIPDLPPTTKKHTPNNRQGTRRRPRCWAWPASTLPRSRTPASTRPSATSRPRSSRPRSSSWSSRSTLKTSRRPSPPSSPRAATS